MRLILASNSPRRAELLRAAGLDFDTLAVPVDEAVRAGEDAPTYVRRLAAEKADAAWKHVSGADVVVLAADTAVVIHGEILGKPRDDHEAEAMLRRLSGERHQVLTGVSARSAGGERGLVASTSVSFGSLSPEEIAWYIASGEGRDKAGGYAIQGLASRFVAAIEGSYANVVGLPVHEVYGLLRILASGR